MFFAKLILHKFKAFRWFPVGDKKTGGKKRDGNFFFIFIWICQVAIIWCVLIGSEAGKKNICSFFKIVFFLNEDFYFSANFFPIQLNSGHCWTCWANKTMKNGTCSFQFVEMQCNAINLPRNAVPFMCHFCMWTVNWIHFIGICFLHYVLGLCILNTKIHRRLMFEIQTCWAR